MRYDDDVSRVAHAERVKPFNLMIEKCVEAIVKVLFAQEHHQCLAWLNALQGEHFIIEVKRANGTGRGANEHFEAENELISLPLPRSCPSKSSSHCFSLSDDRCDENYQKGRLLKLPVKHWNHQIKLKKFICKNSHRQQHRAVCDWINSFIFVISRIPRVSPTHTFRWTCVKRQPPTDTNLLSHGDVHVHSHIFAEINEVANCWDSNTQWTPSTINANHPFDHHFASTLCTKCDENVFHKVLYSVWVSLSYSFS